MEVILHQRFQKRIAEAIEAEGINQSELARRMGVSRQFVSQYLSGQKCPGLDVVEKFAKALKVDPIELLSRESICQPVA